MAAQAPAFQHRYLFIAKAASVLHAEVRVLRHGNHGFEHVGAAFGARQQRVITQGKRRAVQVAFAAVMQIQADQIDHALTRFF